MKEAKFEIFKVLINDENSKIIERIYDVYHSQENVGRSLRSFLVFSNATVTLDKLQQLSESKSDEHLLYVCMLNKKLTSTFTHIYSKNCNEMYLNESYTHPNLRGKGLGTQFYKLIIQDIFKNFNVKSITATAETNAGRMFLEKLGFMPNTKPITFGGNAVLYNPEMRNYIFKIRLEKLNELCPNRKLFNAPHAMKFNEEIKKLIEQGKYDESERVKLFLACQNKSKILKKAKIVKPSSTILSMGGKKFIFYEEDKSHVTSELDYNLNILNELQNSKK